MKKSALLFILLVLLTEISMAQDKVTETRVQFWTAYNNQTRFSKKWGAWLDVHLRTKEDFFSGLSQFIFRPGITYYLNDATKATVGYAYVKHFPGDNHSEISQPEHRIWQQVHWNTKY